MYQHHQSTADKYKCA